jgi:hypothetical protein
MWYIDQRDSACLYACLHAKKHNPRFVLHQPKRGEPGYDDLLSCTWHPFEQLLADGQTSVPTRSNSTDPLLRPLVCWQRVYGVPRTRSLDDMIVLHEVAYPDRVTYDDA